MHELLRLNFSSPTPDHRILNIAYQMAQECEKQSVILVTKDVNLRMKARSIGIQAEDKTNAYRQILLARPIVPLSNRDIGYLPRNIDSKLKPYMQPLWDNLGVIRSNYKENSEMNKNIGDAG